MNSSPLTQPQLVALGCGAVFILIWALWLSWKLGKLLVKAALGLLLLAALGAGIWWALAAH